MANGMVKKICIIAGAILFVFVMIVLLCGAAFVAGSISGFSPVQREGYEYNEHISRFQPKQPSVDALSQLEKDMVAATALLYHEDENGIWTFRCTATAFDRDDGFYHFVTAAHCVAKDDVANRLVKIMPGKWFLNFHTPDQKDFYRAHILAVGYQKEGDDLAVLEARLDRYTHIVRLSDEDPKMGESVSNLAGPIELGKQLFRGYISREAVPGNDKILVQVHCGGGSSGSAIVSHEKKAIVAILVERISGWFVFEPMADISVAIPISKFHRFWVAVQARNYEYFDWRSFGNIQSDINDLSDSDELFDAGIGGVED